MGWPIYSETFIRTYSVGVWTVYVVPLGHRAVIKSILMVQSVAIAWSFTVEAGGVPVGYRTFPAAADTYSVSLMAVVHGGGTIRSYGSAGTVSQTISGFLFTESPGSTREARRTFEVPYEEAELLPSV